MTTLATFAGCNSNTPIVLWLTTLDLPLTVEFATVNVPDPTAKFAEQLRLLIVTSPLEKMFLLAKPGPMRTSLPTIGTVFWWILCENRVEKVRPCRGMQAPFVVVELMVNEKGSDRKQGSVS